MNSKSFHWATLFLLFLTTFAVNAKDLNPAYCSSIPLQSHGWNEKDAKATLTGIPKDCQKLWCAYALDGTWESWSDVGATWTPGSTITVTSTIVPGGTYWEATSPAWPGGAASNKKPGFVAFCLWSPTNTDHKNQDCTAQIVPSNYDCINDICTFRQVPYCDNYRVCLSADGKSVRMSGLNNYTSGDWFAYSDDGWASYTDDTLTLALGQDEICLDFSQKKYTSGPKEGLTIETPLTGSLSILADASGPNKCTAFNTGVNNKNGIDLTAASVCSTCVPSVSVNEVTIYSITISPNPTTPSETITIKGEYAADAKVSITSVGGAMVGSVVPSVGADAMAVSLSGLNLQTGIYFVRIDSGVKVYVGKLCVK